MFNKVVLIFHSRTTLIIIMKFKFSKTSDFDAKNFWRQIALKRYFYARRSILFRYCNLRSMSLPNGLRVATVKLSVAKTVVLLKYY